MACVLAMYPSNQIHYKQSVTDFQNTGLFAHFDFRWRSNVCQHSDIRGSAQCQPKTDKGFTDLLTKTEMRFQLDITKNGVKRKAVVSDFDEIYIPSKRVSPLLNTPIERRDERKKILKISANKIKKLDDPENFLRRSVLVNNLTKRLQTELRQEKQTSRKFNSYKRKFFTDNKVLNNNCLSDSYLCDDPFLSCTYEAITDDMTDTLIDNVLNDNRSVVKIG